MIGIGIVIHNDVINRGELDETSDPLELLSHLIKTIDLYTKENYVLIIRDNDSLDFRFRAFHIYLKKEFKHIQTVFISSEVNSLTDAWNEILKISFNDFNCEAVALLNQDILVTKSWSNFIQAIKRQNRDFIAPMSSGAVYQPLQSVDEQDFIEKDKIIHVASVQGFCFGASRRAFEENKYDVNNFFDPNIEWDYNEEEWEQRNNNTGGRTLILNNVFVVHLDLGSWLPAGLRSTKRPEVLYSRDYIESIINTFKYSDYIRGQHDN